MQNFYQILNISPSAKETEIKESLRNSLRLWTNRTNAPQIDRRQEAERMVKLIEEAETTLLDAAKRADYDRKLKAAAAEQPASDQQALDSVKNLIEEGRRLLGSGNIGDALYVATKATEREGGNPEAWALLGEARFRFGDIDDAIYEYKRAIKLKPNEPFYYLELGDILSQAGKLDDALGQYERAAKTAPTVPMFRAAVGNALLRQEKSSQAIPIFEQCMKEDPENESFQWGLAIAYVDSCQDNWTYVGKDENVPEGYYATSKAQVLEALEFIRKADQLKYDDPVLKEHIARVKEDVKRMLQRRYHGRTFAAIVGGFVYLPLVGLGLVFAPFYFYASRPPQYALNKNLIKGPTAGDKALAAVGSMVERSEGGVAAGLGVATLLAVAALLPVMAILCQRSLQTDPPWVESN